MKGLRWYKCDFHLHTSASKCFIDEKSLDKWIDKVLKEGLNCIAVTDHNTAENIDEIKLLGREKGIVVFPGVEITCSDAKVHLLVIFDIDKDKLYVEDFLIKCNINRLDFGKDTAQSDKSIDNIVDIANEMGGIVIPAHIDDEHCSLESVGHYTKTGFLGRNDVRGVQIVKREYLDKAIYKDVISNECATLTFSDNPHKDDPKKHGIDGIGNRYTWIKLSQKPNLSSLKQAMIMHNLRIKSDFDENEYPYKSPNTWIKNISMKNSYISENIDIEFSPQMNTIIGGRGSGKSSILKFIFGVLRKDEQIKQEENLKNIISEHLMFFRMEKDDIGVFREDTEIILTIIKDNLEYYIKINAFKGNDFKTQIYTVKSEQNIFIEDEEFIYFLGEDVDVYLQKQIYEISKDTNILKKSIDKNIDLTSLREQNIKLRNTYLDNMIEIKKLSESILNKESIKSNLKSIELKLDNINDTELSTLLIEQDKLNKNYSAIKHFENKIDLNIIELNNFLYKKPYSFSENLILDEEVKSIIEQNNQDIDASINNTISCLNKQLKDIKDKYIKDIGNSNWNKIYNNNKSSIDKFIGISGLDIDTYNKIIDQRKKLTQSIIIIEDIERKIEKIYEDNKIILEEYRRKRDLISDKRIDYLKENFDGTNSNLKIVMEKNRDKVDFEKKVRKILNKEKGKFNEDIDKVINYIFNSNSIVKHIDNLVEYIIDLKNKKVGIHKPTIFLSNNRLIDTKANVLNEVAVTMEDELYEEIENKLKLTAKFKNILATLDDESLINIKLLIPEDLVKFQYRTNKTNKFKSIDTASAGQKTSAILTYILSKGTGPLILDQPEDDLDNKIIYDLIINTLKLVKEERQIIVVTHNANIPVNGDSENIIAVDYTDKNGIDVEVEGSIEDEDVKNAIFDIMEGGEEAFEIRSKRYGYEV